MKRILFLIVIPFLMISCRTLNPGAESVRVLDQAPVGCESRGSVYADWAFWGAPSEILNVERNQAMQLGANSIWQQHRDMAFAYKCPGKE